MQPWQQSQISAQQAQQAAQRGMQYGIDSARRHSQGTGRRPTGVLGRIVYGIVKLIGLAIALAILAVVAVVGYVIVTNR